MNVSEVVSIKKIWFDYKMYVIMILVGTGSFFLPVFTDASNPDQSELPNKYFDMIPFYWTVGIIGGCIGLTLAYVSWRKYRGEGHNKRKDQDR